MNLYPKTNKSFNKQKGVALVVMVALVAIMFLLVMANGRTLSLFRRELQLLEKQQLKHAKDAFGTNQISQVQNLQP